MGVSSSVLAGLEGAPENGMDSDGVKIIGRDDASGGDLGTVTDAERGAHDFADDEGVDESGIFLEVEEVGPGDAGRVGFAASGSGKREELFLVSYERVGAKQDSFDPTEDGGVGADSQGEAENRENRKAGTAPEHAEADAEVLKNAVE